jgi:hypothetical protein
MSIDTNKIHYPPYRIDKLSDNVYCLSYDERHTRWSWTKLSKHSSYYEAYCKMLEHSLNHKEKIEFT